MNCLTQALTKDNLLVLVSPKLTSTPQKFINITSQHIKHMETSQLLMKKLYQTFGGNLKFFGIGGAKLDSKTERFLRDAKFPYAIGYGLTETSPLLAGSNPLHTKFQAIGPKVIDCEVIINNPDPKTGEGEIWGRGPNIMLGYYKNEARTREVLTEDGWFKTGDLGVFDKKGNLTHKGRLKNLIVGPNGENIYPEEIESLINNFRHVVESLVVEQKGKLVALVHFDRDAAGQRRRGWQWWHVRRRRERRSGRAGFRWGGRY
jgi:long-chain acyl-CoA synthetase